MKDIQNKKRQTKDERQDERQDERLVGRQDET
jgi:hypothetical protein